MLAEALYALTKFTRLFASTNYLPQPMLQTSIQARQHISSAQTKPGIALNLEDHDSFCRD